MKVKEKNLERFLRGYTSRYYGNLRSLEKFFLKAGIQQPIVLDGFDGEATFHTASGEQITLSDDIEDYFAIMTVKRRNLQKMYSIFFQTRCIYLNQVIVDNGKNKLEINLGNNQQSIIWKDKPEVMILFPKQEITNYLESLPCNVDPKKVWKAFQAIIKMK